MRNKISSFVFGLFVFTFTLFGCLGCVSISKPSSKIIKTTAGDVIKKEHSFFPIQSFIMTRQNFVVYSTLCNESGECETAVVARVGGTASGVIIETDSEKSYVLTAGHVCVPGEPTVSVPGRVNVTYKIDLTTGFGRVGDADLIAVDTENDLCLLKADRFLGPGLKIQNTKTKLHSRVYNMAHPSGLATSLAVPVFDGYYAGRVSNRDMYTVPGVPGSSGSPIMNSENEVITIISAAAIKFDEFVICPTTESIRAFLLANLPVKPKEKLVDKIKNKLDLKRK